MPAWTVIYQNAYLPLLAALAVASLVWGDATVRRATGVTFLAMAALELVPRTYGTLLWPAAAADCFLLLAYGALSIRSPRWWLLTLSAMQLLSVLGHLTKAIRFEMTALTYAILQGGMAYLQLILLAIAWMTCTRWSRSKGFRSAIGSPGGTISDTESR